MSLGANAGQSPGVGEKTLPMSTRASVLSFCRPMEAIARLNACLEALPARTLTWASAGLRCCGAKYTALPRYHTPGDWHAASSLQPRGRRRVPRLALSRPSRPAAPALQATALPTGPRVSWHRLRPLHICIVPQFFQIADWFHVSNCIHSLFEIPSVPKSFA